MANLKWTIRNVPDEAVEIIQCARLVTGKHAGEIVSEAVLVWAKDFCNADVVGESDLDVDWDGLLANLQEHLEKQQQAIRELQASLVPHRDG